MRGRGSLTYALTHFLTHKSSPPKSRHYFIRDQQRPVCARNLRHAPQPAARLGDHSGCALHQRLEDEGGVRITAFLLRAESLLNLSDAFPVALAIFPRIS